MLSQKTPELLDSVSERLGRYAEYILVFVFGLLPVFFVPMLAAPLGFSKTLFVGIGVALACIFYSLAVLRSGKWSFSFPYPLAALWLVAGVAFVSAILSGDLRDALTGDQFGIHTAAFMALLALSATIWTFLGTRKTSVMWLYMLLALSTMVLVLFHIGRLFLGADTLSFGVFLNNAASPIGGWNDLALFLGVSILLSLVAFEQLPLTKSGRMFFGAVVVLALVMLAVIGFSSVWFVLAAASLVMLVYTLGSARAKRTEQLFSSDAPAQGSSTIVLLVVFLTSVVFILGGSALSGSVANMTNLSYVEVRPSFEATVDIAREVYTENAFLGSGTNTFSDAWRLYKNESINTSAFWATDFNGGSGYVPTFFVTTGVLGGVAWLLFIGSFVVFGIRMLITSTSTDRTWNFISVSAFVSAVYIWGMALVYIPGPAVLLVGALCTGLTFAARGVLVPQKVRTYQIPPSGSAGFLATGVVIVVLVASVSMIYTAGSTYAAVYTYNTAVQTESREGATREEIETLLVQAYTLVPNDVFVRRLAQHQLARMNLLAQATNPTEAQVQEFTAARDTGIDAATRAVAVDPTDPMNWGSLGALYGFLSSLGVEGASDRAREALTRAQELDPKNPARQLALANLASRGGDLAAARTHAEAAIVLKSNYSDALFFLAQLDIAEGDTEGAIAAVRAVVTLEPSNPARYYQLGVLELSRGEYAAAASVFERAVQLDTNYANARYFLAITYDALDRQEDAKVQLEHVLALNPGNEQVLTLLEVLETDGNLDRALQVTPTDQISETRGTVSEKDAPITTEEEPDSPLVTPVNVVPDTETDSTE